MKKIGIRATIKTYESAAGYKAYDAGEFQFMVQGRTLSLMDPDVVYAQWVNSTMTRWGAGGAPGANFQHPNGFEDLYKQQSQELDLEKRKAIVRQMEDILMNEDAQYINLFWGARAFRWPPRSRTSTCIPATTWAPNGSTSGATRWTLAARGCLNCDSFD